MSSTSSSSSYLDIKTLYHQQIQREENKKEYYEQIIRKIHARIETCAKRNELRCLFQIPEFVIGIPLYNRVKCSRYAMSRLSNEGFFIKYIHPYIIFIDWSKEMIEPFIQSPSLQLPTAIDYATLPVNVPTSTESIQSTQYLYQQPPLLMSSTPPPPTHYQPSSSYHNSNNFNNEQQFIDNVLQTYKTPTCTSSSFPPSTSMVKKPTYQPHGKLFM